MGNTSMSWTPLSLHEKEDRLLKLYRQQQIKPETLEDEFLRVKELQQEFEIKIDFAIKNKKMPILMDFRYLKTASFFFKNYNLEWSAVFYNEEEKHWMFLAPCFDTSTMKLTKPTRFWVNGIDWEEMRSEAFRS